MYIIILVTFCSIIFPQWSVIDAPNNQSIEKTISDGSRIYVATFTAEVYTSQDDGLSWGSISTEEIDVFPYGIDLFSKAENYLFLSQNISEGPFNFRSYYNGENWEPFEIISFQSGCLNSLLYNNGDMFTIMNGGIGKSSDFGSSWEMIESPPTVGYINLLFIDDEYLFANHGCNLYKKAHLDSNWQEITGLLNQIGPPEPYSCTNISDLEKFNNDLIASTYWGGGVGSLFKSSNEGESWEFVESFPSLSGASNGQNNISSLKSKNNVFYAGTASSQGGIYYTEDFIDWYEYNNGLESYALSVSNLVASDEYLYKSGGVVNTYQILLVESSILSGDINNDGAINILDVVQLVSFILGTNNPNDGEMTTGDLNSDGILNILDVVALVGIILES